MYEYIYIYMNVHMLVRLDAWLSMCICVYVYMFICVYVYMCICV